MKEGEGEREGAEAGEEGEECGELHVGAVVLLLAVGQDRTVLSVRYTASAKSPDAINQAQWGTPAAGMLPHALLPRALLSLSLSLMCKRI
jgi:hypothetical protein